MLEELLPRIREYNAQWLAKNHPGPFLLRQRGEEEIRSGPSRAVGLTCLPGQVHPIDLQNLAALTEDLDSENELLERYQLYPITKSNRNIFGNGITVGRAQNNDVVVPLASVSKFHAWVQPGKDGSFAAFDARSRFGTFVDDVRASPEGEKGLPIRPGSVLRLGEVPLTFMDALYLHRWALEQLKAYRG
jgi:hypothetical protein